MGGSRARADFIHDVGARAADDHVRSCCDTGGESSASGASVGARGAIVARGLGGWGGDISRTKGLNGWHAYRGHRWEMFNGAEGVPDVSSEAAFDSSGCGCRCGVTKVN